MLTCEFDYEVPFMFSRETRPDIKRGEVGRGGVKFVDVVNDREIRISLKNWMYKSFCEMNVERITKALVSNHAN